VSLGWMLCGRIRNRLINDTRFECLSVCVLLPLTRWDQGWKGSRKWSSMKTRRVPDISSFASDLLNLKSELTILQ
jgi:hypothetical protein